MEDFLQKNSEYHGKISEINTHTRSCLVLSKSLFVCTVNTIVNTKSHTMLHLFIKDQNLANDKNRTKVTISNKLIPVSLSATITWRVNLVSNDLILYIIGR